MAETRGSTGTSGKQAKKEKKDAKSSRQKDQARSGGMNGGDGQASDTVEQVQHQAGHIVDAAREEAKGQITEQISQQKARTASSLGILASSLHDASRQVREQDGGAWAQSLDMAATQVDQFADALEKQDVLQIVNSANELGRRQPALFMAGAFALGFAGVRLMKSGTPDEKSQSQERGRAWSQPSSADRFGGYGGYPPPGGTGFDAGNRGSGTDTALDYGRSTPMGQGSRAGTARASDVTSTGSMVGNDWSAAGERETGPEMR